MCAGSISNDPHANFCHGQGPILKSLLRKQIEVTSPKKKTWDKKAAMQLGRSLETSITRNTIKDKIVWLTERSGQQRIVFYVCGWGCVVWVWYVWRVREGGVERGAWGVVCTWVRCKCVRVQVWQLSKKKTGRLRKRNRPGVWICGERDYSAFPFDPRTLMILCM